MSLAGLLAYGSWPDAGLPGFPVATLGIELAADSCGGSHGFGPCWVVLTVFPFNPLESIRRGTIDPRRIALPGRGRQATGSMGDV